jgi:magnesium-transporting ATPase (P-type)
MKNCTISVYLAYTMAAYFFSSIYYLIVSRFVDTPFYNSLTTKQQEIKSKSVKKRRNIFYQGMIISLLGLIFFKPFHVCI